MDLSDNGLTAGLGAADRALLQKRCAPVQLLAGDVLSRPGEPGGHVYFLAGATVACVVQSTHGASLALGLAGRDGAAGLQLALGLGAGNFTLMVQTAGGAWRADGDALYRLVQRRPAMLLAFSRHLWAASEQVAAQAARAQSHDVKARLAGWILLSAQQGHVGDLRLTHEHLAAMLGVRRVSVTLAAAELREARLVAYQRGRLRVLDWAGLEAAAQGSGAPHQQSVARSAAQDALP